MTPKEQYISDLLDARAIEAEELNIAIHHLVTAQEQAIRKASEAYDRAHARYIQETS